MSVILTSGTGHPLNRSKLTIEGCLRPERKYNAMKYEKGTFTIVPNLDVLEGTKPELQTIFMWLCSFSDKEGQCFPSRAKLGRVCGIKSVRTIDKYLTELIELGLISKTKRKKKGSEENSSNVYQILEVRANDSVGGANKSTTPGAFNDTTPGAFNVPITISNRTIPNRTIVTPEVSGDSQEEVIKSLQLPKERGKTYILRVLSVYRDLFEELYGFKPVISIPRYSKQVKELAFLKSELEIASLLIVFFDWYGVTGNDSFEREKLVKAQHPLGWFFASINSYEAHLRNVIGLKIEDENELRAFVAKRMLSIKK